MTRLSERDRVFLQLVAAIVSGGCTVEHAFDEATKALRMFEGWQRLDRDERKETKS